LKKLSSYTNQLTIQIMKDTKIGRVVKQVTKGPASTEVMVLATSLLQEYHNIVEHKAKKPDGAPKDGNVGEKSTNEEKNEENKEESNNTSKGEGESESVGVEAEKEAELGGYEDDVEDLATEKEKEEKELLRE